MEILTYLKESKIIKRFEILDYKNFHQGFYLKISCLLIDNSKLYIREYSDVEERNYSYHWQDTNNNLITRWDNAPHYPDISTHPHHKHTKDGVFENYTITIEEILSEIKTSIDNKLN